MPIGPILPQIRTQPQSPEDLALQDELAKRAQAEWPAWKQNTLTGLGTAKDFISGLFSSPDADYSIAKKWGVLAGASLPIFGAARRVIGPGMAGSGSEAMQELLNLLYSYKPKVTPEMLAEAVANSRVTPIRGVPNTYYKAPEGFDFPMHVHLEDKLSPGTRTRYVPRELTEANKVNAKWRERDWLAKEQAMNTLEVPTTTSLTSLKDASVSNSARVIPESRITLREAKAAQGGLSSRATTAMKQARGVSVDDIRKIRSFRNIDEAVEAFPNLKRDKIKAIFNRESFPHIK